jgi:DNA-3-methyladenine glycosylase II
MGLSAERLKVGLDAIAALEPRMAEAVARIGYPEPRLRPTGYATLARTIVGQQVSTKAADAVWAKFGGISGDPGNPAALLALSDEELRGAGLSRQKAGYLRSLAELTVSGTLDFANLPSDDDDAVALLTSVKGIGRWSAEVYLLFAEGRGDIWPAGDLAVQIEMGRILQLDSKPSEKRTRDLADPWRPYRGAAAVFLWHHYNTTVI